MSKSDRCSRFRVLSDAFADQFHSCLLILLVLSPPHTTSHHRHHKYQLAQNMSELYQSCVFTAVKTNMSLKTDIHCLLSFRCSFFSLFIFCPSSMLISTFALSLSTFYFYFVSCYVHPHRVKLSDVVEKAHPVAVILARNPRDRKAAISKLKNPATGFEKILTEICLT